jgi:hypothetical protein
MHTAKTDAIVYGDRPVGFNPEQWKARGSETKAFVEGYMLDKRVDSGDLWKEDEYLQYGEGAFGDLGLFDTYGDE